MKISPAVPITQSGLKADDPGAPGAGSWGRDMARGPGQLGGPRPDTVIMPKRGKRLKFRAHDACSGRVTVADYANSDPAVVRSGRVKKAVANAVQQEVKSLCGLEASQVPAEEALSGVGEPCDILDSNDEMDAQEESTQERSGSRKKKSKRHKKDSEDEKDDHKNVCQQRQAASKAASKQREMLLEDVGSEEEPEEDDEAPFQEKDSGSDEDFLMEEDDDSDYGSSEKKNKKMVKKSKPERKEKKMPKPRLKATVTPSPVKGKGKVGRPTASKTSKEKTPSPKEEDEEAESPPEKKTSASPHSRSLGTKALKMKPLPGKIKSDIWGEVLLETEKETSVGHGLGCGSTPGLSVLFHLSRIMFSSLSSISSLSNPLYAYVFKLPFCLSLFFANPLPLQKPCQLITGLCF